MEDKWADLHGSGYRLENLGRPAVFLLPSHKLRMRFNESQTVEEALHVFLIEQFGAFTNTTVPYFGFWRGGNQEIAYDECRRYEVSFDGKERIPILLAKLAEILKVMNEECAYVTAGQYACLVYPDALKEEERV